MNYDMEIGIGKGGWYALDGSDLDLPGRLYARASDVDGHVRVTEIYVDGRGEPIQTEALRRIPLAAIEALVGEVVHDLGQGTSQRSQPGPNLSTLASHFSSSVGGANSRGGYHGRRCEHCNAALKGSEAHAKRRGRDEAYTDWIALSLIAQSPIGQDLEVARARSHARSESKPEIRLSAPVEGLTDEFLTDVGRAYAAAVRLDRPPASAIAEAGGHDRRTVESWIYKARKRGLMPPASKRGRVR